MEEDRTGVWAVAWPGSLPGTLAGTLALHGERDRPDGAAATAALLSLTVRLGHPVFYLALLN